MRNGFTLIELLVVLVIIGMISAFVVPRFVSPLENTRLKTSAKRISATLRYVSNASATEKKAYIVFFDLKHHRLGVMPAEKFEKADIYRLSFDEGGQSFKSYEFPEKVSLIKARTTIHQLNPRLFAVYFFPNGSSSGGEIVLANERGNKYAIQIDFITSLVEVKQVS
ncbi:MAG: prepilin-type N-terminal cleavage/methylation domain-containing protein [Desulfobacterales bacterium]|nr:prepilin-type N-terminal cleavage/methylation domain-containing protein [Desulfobacterales bacterium]